MKNNLAAINADVLRKYDKPTSKQPETASASQNREQQINPLLQNQDGSPKWKNPDTVMQRGDLFGIPTPAKPAHTPSFRDLFKAILDGDGFAFDQCVERFNKIAAERDMLKANNKQWRQQYLTWTTERDRLKEQAREFEKLAVKAERERDQAREQIKRLLVALKLLHDNLAEYQRINHLGGYYNQDMREARSAIKSVESEGK